MLGNEKGEGTAPGHICDATNERGDASRGTGVLTYLPDLKIRDQGLCSALGISCSCSFSYEHSFLNAPTEQ